MTVSQNQIDHLKAHQDLFDEAYGADGEGRDVDEYIAEYDDSEHPDLYANICSDLGIEPVRETTQRGFEFYCKFRDRYGSEVRVQRSSLAFEECVWIFASDNPDPRMTDPSPHLTVEMAETVRDALTAFIEESEEYKERKAAEHLAGWAPGNLMHHIGFDHPEIPGPIRYDMPLDDMHRAAHAKEDQ